ncbi:SRPBCC family protein [Pedobacter sp.]|uniref:SRPBCC family protein n=1 Tax=Pedobacter sp. TaxID=1411316 RepID=UPI003D7F9CBA
MVTPFEFEQVYDAPIEKVWQALTDENKMRAWYFPQLIKFKPVVGFEFVFSNDGSTYQKEWRVTKIEEGHLLAHSWIYKGYPGSSEVTFGLFEEGEKTKLKLTHTGLSSFPADPHFARKRFEDGWKQILGSNLKDHLK